MTAQIPDRIFIDGVAQTLCVLPLESLFNSMPQRPIFRSEHTANWRGYQASWKVENKTLWLIDFRGTLDTRRNQEQSQRFYTSPSGSRVKHLKTITRINALPMGPDRIINSEENWSSAEVSEDNGFIEHDAAAIVTLDDIIKASEVNPLISSWYSGLLRIPIGERLDYVHGGFLSTYEKDLIIQIEKGRIENEWVIDNVPGHKAREFTKVRMEKSMHAIKPGVSEFTLAEYKAAAKNPEESAQKWIQGKGNYLNVALDSFLKQHFYRVAESFLAMSDGDQEARISYEAARDLIDSAKSAIGDAISLREDLLRTPTPLSEIARDYSFADFVEILEARTNTLKTASRLIYDLKIPLDSNEMLIWAKRVVANGEEYIANEKFELLGAAMAVIFHHAISQE